MVSYCGGKTHNFMAFEDTMKLPMKHPTVNKQKPKTTPTLGMLEKLVYIL